MKRLFLAAAVAAAAFSSSALTANAQTPAVTYTGISTLSDPRPFTLGWAFNLSAPTTVTHLGIWDGGATGDFLAGIWKSDGTLLASTTVLGTDASSNGYRWHSIASLALGAGSYVVAGEFRGGFFPSFATGVNLTPDVTWGGDLQNSGSGLNFPTSSTGGGYGDNGILWANFATDGGVSTVPEPSTYALMFAGLVAVGVARRRSVKERSTLA
jgi:hypothetical protein